MPEEILPGIHHWMAPHPDIGVRVSSYLIEPAGIVLDPMIPEEGWEALPATPRQVVLTSGHHGRQSAEFAERFSIPIRATREAEEHLGGTLPIERFAPDEKVAPGVTAIHVGVLCPDEGALHIELGDGAIAIADALTTHNGELGFFRDELLGDDPEAIKRGLTTQFAELLQRDFDHLMFAHGAPVIGGAKAALREFVAARTDT